MLRPGKLDLWTYSTVFWARAQSLSGEQGQIQKKKKHGRWTMVREYADCCKEILQQQTSTV